MRIFHLAAVLLLFVVPALAQIEPPDDLLANPEYMEEDIKPTFVKVTTDELLKSVRVISGRSYAMFGYNTPEVQILFPAWDNNVYMEAKFSEAILVDEGGNEVAYEREQGIYDHESYSNETRFASLDGDSLVEFAKASGTVRIRYPSVIHTIKIKASDAVAMKKAGLSVENDVVVKIYEDGGIAEEAFTSPIEGLRVYDSKGRRLKAYQGWSSGGGDDSGSYRKVAYHGRPASFEADMIDEWIGVEFTYEVPPARKRKNIAAGMKPENDVFIAEGKVTGKAVNIIPPEVLGWYADMSREDLEAEIKSSFHYQEISESNMLQACVRGELDAVKMFLAAGISPDATYNGTPALVQASMFGQPETARLLIAAGANVDAQDETESTAMIRAASSCENTELVKALIAAGANVNAKAKGGATSIMMANVMKCSEMAAALKAAGAK